MRFLGLIFKDLKMFIKNKTWLFIFLVISQIVCSMAIILVCGLTNQAYTNNEKLDDKSREFSFSYYRYSDNAPLVNVGEVSFSVLSDETKLIDMKTAKKNITQLIDFLGEDFSVANICGNADIPKTEMDYGSFITVWNNDAINRVYDDEMKDFYFTDKKVVAVSSDNYKEMYNIDIKAGDKITIKGTEYTVKYEESAYINTVIPYNAIPDDYLAGRVSIYLSDQITEQRRDEIKGKILELFGNGIADTLVVPEVIDLQDQQFNNMIYVITAIIILIVLMNIGRVYSYILSQQKQSLAIMSICGATKFKLYIIYITEIIMSLVLTFGIGLLIFHTLLIQPLSVFFNTFTEFFTFDIYKIIFAVYFAAALIIISFNIIPFTSKTSVDMERRGKV